ncbi:Uncharacterized conserved protein YndB, AHSA1/START domain [Roseomonas rosea]|uniref:Uncharacterized conserved protein YndB, AHSA1/START domain n=1 Tax=Muricoccus roseus TaxID=198092 RepID=A0A1M6NL68_9PROT|nr:SRPBCC family protein [Roseomonas rosea]SHJ96481.1 Uncharacterized conserved protein YndB, AHSA1/START domain [Roseomonas rosea]
MSDRIEKTIELKAPQERVWRALTDHESFGAWFGARIDGPFIPGEVSTGRITIPGYEHVRWEAVVERMEPQHLFAYRWHPYAVDPAVDYSGETMTLVEFRLETIPGGTRLTATESGFDALPAMRRPEAFRMNSEGWPHQLRNIQHHVELQPAG